MKTLIITAETRDYIRTTWLPSLREKAKYTGDVLIVDYNNIFGDLADERTIVYHPKKKELRSYACDRFRVFAEALAQIWTKYDVIMHSDGGDVEFLKPIDELLKLSQKDLCCIYEGTRMGLLKDRWKAYYSLPDAFVKAIENEKDINMGIFSGPAELVYSLINLMAIYYKDDGRLGHCELIFNSIVYYFQVPHIMVDLRWNTYQSNAFILHKYGTIPKPDNDWAFETPKVCIITPTTDINSTHFKQCYENLKKYTKIPYEYIVVESHLNEFLFNFPRVVNIGLKDLSYDYYVLLNDDVFVTENWLETLIETVRADDSIGIIAPLTINDKKVINHGGGELDFVEDAEFQWITRHAFWFKDIEGIDPECFRQRDCIFVNGALFFITNKCLRTIGGQDEKLKLAFGDVEYCLRAWEHGFRVVYQPKCLVTHLGGTTVRNKFKTWDVPKKYAGTQLRRYTQAEYDSIAKKVSDSNAAHWYYVIEQPKSIPSISPVIKPVRKRGNWLFRNIE